MEQQKSTVGEHGIVNSMSKFGRRLFHEIFFSSDLSYLEAEYADARRCA
jgi:hypothetical protein